MSNYHHHSQHSYNSTGGGEYAPPHVVVGVDHHQPQPLPPAEMETTDLVQVQQPHHHHHHKGHHQEAIMGGGGDTLPQSVVGGSSNVLHVAAAASSATTPSSFPGSPATPLNHGSPQGSAAVHGCSQPVFSVEAATSLLSPIEREEKMLICIKPFPNGFKSKTWDLVLAVDLEETRYAWEAFLNEKGGMEYLAQLEEEQEAAGAKQGPEEDEQQSNNAFKPRKKDARARKRKAKIPRDEDEANSDYEEEEEDDDGEGNEAKPVRRPHRLKRRKPFEALQTILKENDPDTIGSYESVGKIVLCKTCFQSKPSYSLNDCIIRCSINLSTKSRHPMVGNVVKHFETYIQKCNIHNDVWIKHQHAMASKTRSPNSKTSSAGSGTGSSKRQRTTTTVQQRKLKQLAGGGTYRNSTGSDAIGSGVGGNFALLSSTTSSTGGSRRGASVPVAVLGGYTKRTWWQHGTGKLRGSMAQLRERCRFAYGWPEGFLGRALEGYRQFMLLKATLGDFDDKTLCPSPIIDQVWQQHVLDMFHYEDDCAVLCGDEGSSSNKSKNNNNDDDDKNNKDGGDNNDNDPTTTNEDPVTVVIVRNPDRPWMDSQSYEDGRRVTFLALQAKFTKRQIDSQIWGINHDTNTPQQQQQGQRRARRRTTSTGTAAISRRGSKGRASTLPSLPKNQNKQRLHPDEEEDDSNEDGENDDDEEDANSAVML